MSARSIVIPAGADIRLCMRPPDSIVVVAPSPLKADLDLLIGEPLVIGMFVQGAGTTWPDKAGCSLASAYLAAGHPILLQFETLADALACQNRLAREMAA